ncbi:MAG: PfkB family carbohydrate kinase [Paracoccus sp. (in: a-proteobacteria)]|uniref:PfkB family carbohydrate kinase n=1 Tax=unclassified Paracoccus (in: a-proteobacteria) TaxID=2688777 RepID=UPI000C531C9C|nr:MULTISPECIES: PfkB family carbohydrate kinase [unclassified Paracoccus (in: a-proteobacteria)]MAN56266.1 kinase [Paracoccus sp. (in: a-proteobacteria)]MBA49019.1 kinase [Paracoccus sp. (in: a-proteobacteria)]HIC65393.1 kinase [Paracoccus sp. (in: a-proteobacteria)]|tara:strand:+ start:1872 stop:2753 length:882 start_codon:yes stop_codon:yes gene_type:complete
MTDRPDILCIGAMLWDVIGRAPRRMAPGADVPGRIRHLPGGVALNVAVALARRGLAPAVLSAVGRDPEGCALVAEAQRLGVLTGWLSRETGLPTDCYMGIEDSEGLIAAIADAHSLERAGGAILAPLSGDLAGWTAPVVLDGNLTEDLLSAIARDPRLAGADLRIVPASPGKAERLEPLIAARRGCFYLNRLEAEILAGRSCPDAAAAAEAVVARGAARVLVTDGAHPAAEAMANAPTLTCAPPHVTVARVTGAGDCFLAAHLAAELKAQPRGDALRRAVEASAAHVSGRDVP